MKAGMKAAVRAEFLDTLKCFGSLLNSGMGKVSGSGD
jgi:hypothetical protein